MKEIKILRVFKVEEANGFFEPNIIYLRLKDRLTDRNQDASIVLLIENIKIENSTSNLNIIGTNININNTLTSNNDGTTITNKLSVCSNLTVSDNELSSSITRKTISENDIIRKKDLLDLIYPVGSIYMSVKSSSPKSLFGGTWEAWGEGRVPVGTSSTDSDFAYAEKTGGEKTHTLTNSEMPSHSHYELLSSNSGQNINRKYISKNSNVSSSTTGILLSDSATTYVSNQRQTSYMMTSSEGDGAAHNNMPPYITCYMWKRTA